MYAIPLYSGNARTKWKKSDSIGKNQEKSAKAGKIGKNRKKSEKINPHGFPIGINRKKSGKIGKNRKKSDSIGKSQFFMEIGDIDEKSE